MERTTPNRDRQDIRTAAVFLTADSSSNWVMDARRVHYGTSAQPETWIRWVVADLVAAQSPAVARVRAIVRAIRNHQGRDTVDHRRRLTTNLEDNQDTTTRRPKAKLPAISATPTKATAIRPVDTAKLLHLNRVATLLTDSSNGERDTVIRRIPTRSAFCQW